MVFSEVGKAVNEGSKVFLNTLRKELRNKVETFIWFGETPCLKVFSVESYNESREKAFLNSVRKVLRKRIETYYMVGETVFEVIQRAWKSNNEEILCKLCEEGIGERCRNIWSVYVRIS